MAVTVVCPLCKGYGGNTKTMERATGRIIQSNDCPLCDNRGKMDVLHSAINQGTGRQVDILMACKK